MHRLLVFAGIYAAIGAASVAAQDRKPARNQLVRVVTVGTDRLSPGDKGGVLEGTLERLDQAASFQPDIVCLPELFTRSAAEPAPGPTTDRLGAWARKHSSYVIAGIRLLSGGRTYNSAVLLDRGGRLIGRFDNIHPDHRQLDSGMTPGVADPPVFETDFGKIGIQICFDVNWWEDWKRLKEKGAKIVFFPAAYPAARQLSAIALANEMFVVSSAGTRPSRIYDITGRVLAASGHYQRWAAAVLPLGRRLYEIDFHIQKVRLLQQKYGPKVDVTWYHDDDWFTLASLAPDLTVEDLEREFGLTPLREYRVRAAKAVEAARRAR